MADLQLLFVRGGLLIGRKDFFWNEANDIPDHELIRSTIEQFYNKDIVSTKGTVSSRHLPRYRIGQTMAHRKERRSGESPGSRKGAETPPHSLGRKKCRPPRWIII